LLKKHTRHKTSRATGLSYLNRDLSITKDQGKQETTRENLTKTIRGAWLITWPKWDFTLLWKELQSSKV